MSESDSVEATPQAAEPPPLSNLLSMICGSTADHPSGLVEGAEGLEDGELPAWAIEVEEGAASGSTDDLPSHFFEARPSILPALLFTFVFFPIMGLLTLLGGAGFSTLSLESGMVFFAGASLILGAGLILMWVVQFTSHYVVCSACKVRAMRKIREGEREHLRHYVEFSRPAPYRDLDGRLHLSKKHSELALVCPRCHANVLPARQNVRALSGETRLPTEPIVHDGT